MIRSNDEENKIETRAGRVGSGVGREWVGRGLREGREWDGSGRVETVLPSLGASSSGGFLLFLLSNRLNHPPIPPFFVGASPSPSSW